MFKVGLTGGIASGKSTVARMFADRSVYVINLDNIARELVGKGTEMLKKIRERFGADILLADGALNRSRLREIIFANAEDKKWLEILLHPAIRGRQDALVRQAAKTRQYPYAMIEIPLLAENKLQDSVDRVLVVDADQDAQIRRAMSRDDVDAEQINSIIESQASREKRNAIADDIIENNGSVEELEVKVCTLHKKFIELARDQ